MRGFTKILRRGRERVLRCIHHAMPGRGAAGVLLFVNRGIVPIFRQMIEALNARGRVSNEVLSLHMVHPSTEAVAQLAADT